MPVSLETRENGHVQYYVVTDPWTVTDLVSHYPVDKIYRDSVPFKVHTVVNIKDSHQLPPGVMDARRGSAGLTPTSGLLIVFGANPIAKLLIETAVRLARYSKLRFFDTEDDAWNFIRQWIAEHPE